MYKLHRRNYHYKLNVTIDTYVLANNDMAYHISYFINSVICTTIY